MNKIKPLIPSLRQKKRYLAYEVVSNGSFSQKYIEKSIYNSAKELLGTLELSKANLHFINGKYYPDKAKGYFQVNNKYVDHMKAALAFVQDIEDKEAMLRSIGVSGTIKKLEAKYFAE